MYSPGVSWSLLESLGVSWSLLFVYSPGVSYLCIRMESLIWVGVGRNLNNEISSQGLRRKEGRKKGKRKMAIASVMVANESQERYF